MSLLKYPNDNKLKPPKYHSPIKSKFVDSDDFKSGFPNANS